MGHAHPVSCVDCHDPATMQLRVTRPGFINGIQALPPRQTRCRTSLRRTVAPGQAGSALRSQPDASATRCARSCAASATWSTTAPARCRWTFPWGKGLKVEEQEPTGTSTSSRTAQRFFDYKHAETGAEILKAQHPEFELWSQGIHARSGVSCADCHMPYMRDGAAKISDHWVRSPLLNINRACQTCHHSPRRGNALPRGPDPGPQPQPAAARAKALMDQLDAIKAAKAAGATEEAAEARAGIAAQGPVAHRLHRRRKLDGLPRPAGGGPHPGRGHRLRAPGTSRRPRAGAAGGSPLMAPTGG
jgi:nitrite reductase (cytochrome c-552)